MNFLKFCTHALSHTGVNTHWLGNANKCYHFLLFGVSSYTSCHPLALANIWEGNAEVFF